LECAYCGGQSREYEFGLLEKIYPTSTLFSYSERESDLISLSESGNEITLTRSVLKASTNNKACVSCNCKKSCDSPRCRCFKN